MKRKAVLTRLAPGDLRKLVALASEEHYGNQARVMRVALRRLYADTFPAWYCITCLKYYANPGDCSICRGKLVEDSNRMFAHYEVP